MGLRWPWKLQKWPWFLANVAVNACQDLATLRDYFSKRSKHCVIIQIRGVKHCVIIQIRGVKHWVKIQIREVKHCVIIQIRGVKHCVIIQIRRVKHCLIIQIRGVKHCVIIQIRGVKLSVISEQWESDCVTDNVCPESLHTQRARRLKLSAHADLAEIFFEYSLTTPSHLFPSNISTNTTSWNQRLRLLSFFSSGCRKQHESNLQTLFCAFESKDCATMGAVHGRRGSISYPQSEHPGGRLNRMSCRYKYRDTVRARCVDPSVPGEKQYKSILGRCTVLYWFLLILLYLARFIDPPYLVNKLTLLMLKGRVKVYWSYYNCDY